MKLFYCSNPNATSRSTSPAWANQKRFIKNESFATCSRSSGTSNATATTDPLQKKMTITFVVAVPCSSSSTMRWFYLASFFSSMSENILPRDEATGRRLPIGLRVLVSFASVVEQMFPCFYFGLCLSCFVFFTVLFFRWKFIYYNCFRDIRITLVADRGERRGGEPGKRNDKRELLPA